MRDGYKMNMLLIAALVAILAMIWIVIRSRNMHLWIWSYAKSTWTRTVTGHPSGVDVYFCFADHYEPYGYEATREVAHARVKRWTDAYPTLATSHHDSDGNHPVHSFFYPAEEYDPDVLDQLKQICAVGIGDVELHFGAIVVVHIRKAVAVFDAEQCRCIAAEIVLQAPTYP